MPKITRHGGVSNARPPEPGVTHITPAAEPTGGVTSAVPSPAEYEEGGEQSFPGSSSQTSSKRQETSPPRSETVPPLPAQTMGSPSGTDPTESSTAPSTDGDPVGEMSPRRKAATRRGGSKADPGR